MRCSLFLTGWPVIRKTFEAPDLESDLKYAKMKVDAERTILVTQMFLTTAYYDFVEKCKEAGIHVPIIPALSYHFNESVDGFTQNLSYHIPDELAEALRVCKLMKKL